MGFGVCVGEGSKHLHRRESDEVSSLKEEEEALARALGHALSWCWCSSSSIFSIFVLCSSLVVGYRAWQALFSTSIITVPFICLPLRCQVHPDLSSLRRGPAAAYLTLSQQRDCLERL
uniref:Uncharacterized protein n=1 Tax=Daphnia galeata TaxID=27404 RepID=A0A8J2WGN1_9CRUS|nr:unnamed protein product [Daphnia galeata]